MINRGWRDPSTRFEHTWIVAPPKSGKTTLLKALIGHDLKAVEQGKASVIVIEGEGQILNALESRELFNRVPLHIIDPQDKNLALNPFVYTQGDEKAERAVIDLLSFAIVGLLGAEMTSKQRGLFRRLSKMMLSLQGATLKMMHGILNGTIRINHGEHTDPDTLHFWQETFYKDTDMRATRDQLAWRIDALLEDNSTMKRIFSSPHNHADYPAFMNQPGVTVIHPSRALLGKEGAAFFGRLAFAQILRAAEGTRSPHSTDIPCYVYVDEAHTYIKDDANVVTLLDEVRKYNVGLHLAHQRVNQLSEQVIDALYNDVGTIIASRVKEPKLLANAMKCEPNLITDCRVGQFMLYIRDQSPYHGIPISVPGTVLERMPKRPHTPRPVYETPQDDQNAAVLPQAPAAPSAPAAPPQPDYGPVFQEFRETMLSVRDALDAIRTTLPHLVRDQVRNVLEEYGIRPKTTIDQPREPFTIDQPGTALIVRSTHDAEFEEVPATASQRRRRRRRGKKKPPDGGWSSEP